MMNFKNLRRTWIAAIAITAAMFWAPRAAALVGDLNADNQVNVGDVSALYANIVSGSTDSIYDLNGDGFVNAGDVSYLYNIILNGQPEEPVADVWILGNFGNQDWAPNVGTLMTYDETNKVYTAAMSGENDMYFSFTTKLGDDAENWDAIASYRFGAVSNGDFVVTAELLGQELSLTKDNYQAFKLPAGEYTLTLNMENMNLVISGEMAPEPIADVWILGNFGNQDWAPNVGTLMTYDETNKVYTAAMSGENDMYFSFTTKLGDDAENWDAIASYRFGAVSNGDFVVTAELLGQELSLTKDNYQAFKLPAGEYTLTLNMENMNLVIAGEMAGEPNPDDDLPDWTVYVNWDGTSAEVHAAKNVRDSLTTVITDANVSIIQSAGIADEVTYILSGESDNGSFYMDGEYKITVKMNGLKLTSTDSAAVNNQDGKRIAVELVEGTENALADGSASAGKAAMMVNGHTEFKGAGSLTLTGNAKHAFWGDEYVELKKTVGNITVASAKKDGFSINQYFEMKGGTVNISNVGDDGIQVEATTEPTDENNGQVIISGGSLTITNTATASKGINAESDVTISGGTVNITSSGMAQWNAKKVKVQSGACISTDSHLTISGGDITLRNSGDGGRGIKADGTVTINGGNIGVTTTGAYYSHTEGSYFDDAKPHAISADGNITIGGGELTLSVAGNASKCLNTKGDINMTAGSINAITTGGGIWDSVDRKTKAPSCIGSDANITIDGGTLTLKSTGPGGKGASCDGVFTMNDGYMEIATEGKAVVYSGSTLYNGNYSGNLDNINSDYKSNAKGVKADTGLVINGGTVIVSSDNSEGIESKAEMTIAGGVVECNTYDDCINASSHLYITGGKVFCNATNNDAIDSNGNLYIRGGLIVAQGASGAECGIDANDEGGYHLYVTGGTFIGIGGTNISRPYNVTGYQPVLMYSGTVSTNVVYTLNDASGNNILAYTLDRTYSGGGGFPGWAPSLKAGPGGGGPGGGGPGGGGLAMLISSPSLKSGSTYTLYSGQSASGEGWHNLIAPATVSGNGTKVASATVNSYYNQMSSSSGGWGW